jgi:alpha,alpha-trehalose phosphorylase
MSAANFDASKDSMASGEPAEAAAPGRAFDGDHGSVDPWCLRQSCWQADTVARDETLFALANGSLGVRGGFEESSSPTQGSFLAGVWERAPIHYHERLCGFARTTDTRVPVAEATAIHIRLGDARVDPVRNGLLDFQRVLNFREGRLFRSVRWRTEQGHTLQLEAERLLPFAHAGLLCIRLRLTSIDYAGPVSLESHLIGTRAAATQGDDPRIGTDSYLSMRTSLAAASEAQACLVQRTNESAIGVACLQRHRARGVEFSGAVSGVDDETARQTYSGYLDAGESVQIEKFVAYAWSRPHEDVADEALLDQAENLLGVAMGTGFDMLARDQASACASFWKYADLAIEGDAASERALNFNLFHLFQSAARDGRSGIAAKGLTGEGYEGHVFWDSETFVLPVLTFIAPALTRASLLWRVNTLDAARDHAREMNHARGALYPWRTLAGDECSAHYPSGSAQYHINAAIAFAIKLYVDASDDRNFLAEGGAEVLFETARIWLQVGHLNARRGGRFCINDVTGPDEYTALVDNNYYTNRMAQEHLRYAAQVAGELANESPTATWNALKQRIDLSDDEIRAWSRAADAMYLPYDERLGILAQDDTFLDKPLWDFAGTPPENYPLLLHYHPLTLYRHQVCKQADALLALVLAGDDVDRGTKRRSFDYYEAVTVHDSTLSASTFAVLAAEVGRAKEADRYFQDGLRVDLDDLHANTSHGAHMAAMAGSWLALVWGFGGLRTGKATLAFDPMLPSRWQEYRFGVAWKGRRVSVSVDRQSAHYTLVEGESLEVTHAGQTVQLQLGQPQSLALSDHMLEPAKQTTAAFPQRFEALIFDLDGVLADTAHLHHAAWKHLADELGLHWDESLGEKLKGVDRAASLEIVLGNAAANYSATQKREMADRKNDYYRKAIETFSERNLLPGALAALEAARNAGLKIALASASRSAAELVKRMGIDEFFDHVVDASTVVHPKPDPEIFQRAAAALGVNPAACLGIEDARAGIAAIKSAGMAALGIGDDKVLTDADAVLPGLSSFRLEDFVVQRDDDIDRQARRSIENVLV